jgi:PhoPQ-activated pathogenicity-related protein
MNFWERAKNFPPALVRLLARHKHGKPLTTTEIWGRCCNLRTYHVDSISQLTTWDTVTLDNMRDFTQACGLDFCDTKAWRRAEDYLRHAPTFRYLHASPQWETYYKPLLIAWRKSHGKVTSATNVWPPLRTLLIRLNPLLEL